MFFFNARQNAQSCEFEVFLSQKFNCSLGYETAITKNAKHGCLSCLPSFYNLVGIFWCICTHLETLAAQGSLTLKPVLLYAMMDTWLSFSMSPFSILQTWSFTFTFFLFVPDYKRTKSIGSPVFVCPLFSLVSNKTKYGNSERQTQDFRHKVNPTSWLIVLRSSESFGTAKRLFHCQSHQGQNLHTLKSGKAQLAKKPQHSCISSTSYWQVDFLAHFFSLKHS